ncbi:MAG TPA: MFS transporter [Bacillota bacterium]|nr:MFS transporter [Bacillota bacterium]
MGEAMKPAKQSQPLKQRQLTLLLLIATVFDGVTQGVLLIQETIARKALFASNFEITLIGVIVNTTLVFSVFFTYFYAHRNKRWLIAGGYLLGRFIFLFSFLIHRSGVFLIFLFFFHSLFSIQHPILNGFFERYFGARRGLVFGVIRSVLMLMMMITALIVGKLLDINPSVFWMILTSVAFSGLVSYTIFFWIESKTEYSPEALDRQEHFLQTYKTIFRDRNFLVYEGLFMTYGFAYMLCLPTVPIFLLKTLKLSYFEMAQAQGVYAQIFMMLSYPFAGRIFDRLDVWKVGAISYGVLVFYPLFFVFSYHTLSKPLAYTGLLVYSLGLSGVNMLWNLGCFSFARAGESFIYQGCHYALTGIRGFIGPLLGYAILTHFGVLTNFILAAVLFFAAAVGNGVYGRSIHRQWRSIP